MVNVIGAPTPITFARNTAAVRLQALQSLGVPFGAKGATATIELDTAADDGLTAGNVLTVTWESYPGALADSVLFTASDTPTADTELPTMAGLVNPDYIAAVASKIGAHFRIAPFFEVYVVPVSASIFRIVIEARDLVEDWQTTVTTDAVGWDVSDAPPLADTTPENYLVVVEVFWEDTYLQGDFRKIGTLEPARDENGIMEMDFSPIFTAEWQHTQKEMPIPMGNVATTFADNLRRYYFRWQERSGSPTTYSVWFHLDPQLVMWGGVSNRLWSAGNYLTGIALSKSLLHWYPTRKQVVKAQPEWLAWFNYTEIKQDVWLEVTEYDDTNTPAAPVLKFDTTPAAVQQFETALFPVGMLALEISDTTLKYRVRVMNDEGAVSDFREYLVDFMSYEGLRFIQYLNGFGCPETLRCAGYHTRAADIGRSESRRDLAPGYTENTAEILQWNFEAQQKNTYRSGFLRRSEVEALQELLFYNEGYEYIGTDEFVPLFVQAKSLKITETTQNLHFVEFVATPRMTLGNYDNTTSQHPDWNVIPPVPVLDGISFWEINLDFIVQP